MPVFNQSRSYIIRFLFVLAFLVILAQLFHLQVLSNEYEIKAEQNALLKKTIYPARGIIYDRKNRPIVKNTLMYDLMVTPSEVRGVDTFYLCQLLGIDTAEFNKRIAKVKVDLFNHLGELSTTGYVYYFTFPVDYSIKNLGFPEDYSEFFEN